MSQMARAGNEEGSVAARIQRYATSGGLSYPRACARRRCGGVASACTRRPPKPTKCPATGNNVRIHSIAVRSAPGAGVVWGGGGGGWRRAGRRPKGRTKRQA